MFWTEVVEAGGDTEDSKYVVRDAQDAPHDFLRCELRVRVWYTMAQTGVTNDKKHDSYATQHFMDLFIDQWIIEHSYIGNEDDPLSALVSKIISVHIHSDNAGSHFKNNRTLNYLSG